MPISITANAATHGQAFSAGRNASRRIAIGTRTRAPSSVRSPTSMAGDISTTAILMNRYGMPQMTAIAAKRVQARRDIDPAAPGVATVPVSWLTRRP